MLYQGCGEEQQEFQLWPNGSLMLTRHGMCVKPISNEAGVYGIKVGIHERVISVVDLHTVLKRNKQYQNIRVTNINFSVARICHNKINIFLASDHTWCDFQIKIN